MEKELTFKSDTILKYKCGCWESSLESPEDEFHHCDQHHNFVQCDEWGKTCVCGENEN